MGTGNLSGELERVCANDAELWEWVLTHLGLRVPRSAVCPGHQAPFEYLKSAYFEPERDLVVWAPRGGGKTRLGAAATVLDLLHKPGCAVRILGGSLEQSLRMWEHLWPDVLRLAGPRLSGREKAGRIELAGGGSAGVLTQSQRAVRGLRIQKLRCDEVEMFDEKVWEAAQLATRSIKDERGKAGGGWDLIAGAVEAMSTAHRPGGLMGRIVEEAATREIRVVKWCVMEVLEKCPEERECASCPLFAECGGALKRKEEGEGAGSGFMRIEDAIAMKRRVSRETWEAEMLCRRAAVKDCVFGNFDVTVHVRERPAGDVRDATKWLAIDFGYANPFVCLWVMVWEDGVVHVMDEHVREQWTMGQHIEEIAGRKWGKVKWVACDPAGAAGNDQTSKSNVALLKDAGYEVKHKPSRIVEGLEMVRGALCNGMGRAGLFVHPRCKRLIEALGAYRYAGNGSEVPVKDGRHDHLIDALRYFYVVNAGSGKGEARGY